MSSNYHHTSGGTGYTVNSDGTVTRQRNSSKTRRKVGLWIFLILSIIISIILGILLYNTSEELNYANNELIRKSSKVDEIRTQYNSLESSFNSVKSYANRIPIIITEIEVVNKDCKGDEIYEEYGDIYSYNAEYLHPVIHYYNIKEQDVTLQVCWYKADGTMKRNDRSPANCTQNKTIHVYKGNNSVELNGWGNVSHTSWPEGRYSVEIWYDDICLGVKHFEVY